MNPNMLRRERFNRVLDHYDLRAGSWTSPAGGAGSLGLPRERAAVTDAVFPRYALVQSSGRGHGYHVTAAQTSSDAVKAAANTLHEDWHPECLFDLDVLAGDEPRVQEGDVVEYDQARWVVHGVDEEAVEGELAIFARLLADGTDPSSRAWDAWDERVHDSELTVVQAADPDERLPVRHDVALVRVDVVFNTVPTPDGARSHAQAGLNPRGGS